MANSQQIIGFWKTTDLYGFCGNWYHATFMLDGNFFTSSEQAFMYKKAVLFGDTETAQKILNAKSPMICKNLGRAVKPFDGEVFEKYKEQFMYDCVFEKFNQNRVLRKQLLETGDAILCEASPKDKIWGIGMAVTDPDFKDMTKWEGQNLLGKTLMKVREELRKKEELKKSNP